MANKKAELVVEKKIKRPKDKARKAYDDALTKLIVNIREQAEAQLGQEVPTCPTCKKQDAKDIGDVRGKFTGIKPHYRCNNCKRTFVSDNAAYGNVKLQLEALKQVNFNGLAAAPQALKMVKEYGINADNSVVARWLRKLTGGHAA